MAKTIWSERHNMDSVIDTMKGLESKGVESFITCNGESWRGAHINPLICYVLWAAGFIDRQEQTGHYITRADTAERAHQFGVKHLWRTVPMSGRMIAREF